MKNKRNQNQLTDCPRCYGTGYEPRIALREIIQTKCGLCKGTGKINNKKGILEMIKWVELEMTILLSSLWNGQKDFS